MGNWYMGGFDGIPENPSDEFGNNDRSRFWVRVGEERKVIFLDDFNWKKEAEGLSRDVVPFGRWEHKINLNGNYRTAMFATCTQGIQPCKFCEAGFRKQYMGAMAVLDVTPFTSRETNEKMVRPRKKLIIAPKQTLKTLEAKKVKRGNLKGLLFSVGRHESKHARCGSDFEFEGQADFAKYDLKEMVLDPWGFDADKAFALYINLFAPIPYDKQVAALSGGATDGLVFRGSTTAVGAGDSGSSDGESIEY